MSGERQWVRYIPSLLGAAAWLGLIAYIVTFWPLLKGGIDATDESFYVQWVSNPRQFDFEITLFGYILAPFWNLVGENIFAFRILGQAAILVAAGVATCVSYRVFFPQVSEAIEDNKLAALSILFSAFGILALSGILFLWLPTPAYNYMSALAGYTFFISMVLCSSQKRLALPIIILAISLSALLFVKTTSFIAFVALTPIATFFLLPDAHTWLRFHVALFAAGSLCTLIIGTLIGWTVVVEFFEFAVQYSKVDQTADRVQNVYLRDFSKTLGSIFDQHLIFWILIALSTVFLFRGRRAPAPRTQWLNLAATACFATAAISIKADNPMRMAIVLFTFASILWFLMKITQTKKLPTNMRQDRLVLIAVAFVASLATAFGTRNGLTFNASFASGLAYFSAISIWMSVVIPEYNEGGTKAGFRAAHGQLYAVLILSMLAVTCIGPTWLMTKQVISDSENPYRLLAPVREQKQELKTLDESMTFYVDEKTKSRWQALQDGAESAGFESGTQLIDLIGIPAAALMLSAHAPGTAWLGGPKHNRIMFLEEALKSTDLESAWILHTPDAVIDDDTLSDHGIDLSRYEVVHESSGIFMAPEGTLSDENGYRLWRLMKLHPNR